MNRCSRCTSVFVSQQLKGLGSLPKETQRFEAAFGDGSEGVGDTSFLAQSFRVFVGGGVLIVSSGCFSLKNWLRPFGCPATKGVLIREKETPNLPEGGIPNTFGTLPESCFEPLSFFWKASGHQRNPFKLRLEACKSPAWLGFSTGGARYACWGVWGGAREIHIRERFHLLTSYLASRETAILAPKVDGFWALHIWEGNGTSGSVNRSGKPAAFVWGSTCQAYGVPQSRGLPPFFFLSRPQRTSPSFWLRAQSYSHEPAGDMRLKLRC